LIAGLGELTTLCSGGRDPGVGVEGVATDPDEVVADTLPDEVDTPTRPPSPLLPPPSFFQTMT